MGRSSRCAAVGMADEAERVSLTPAGVGLLCYDPSLPGSLGQGDPLRVVYFLYQHLRYCGIKPTI